MNECCNTCKRKMKLVKLDFSQDGCKETYYDGFACLAFANEGEVDHMFGLDPTRGICEMYSPREE